MERNAKDTRPPGAPAQVKLPRLPPPPAEFPPEEAPTAEQDPVVQDAIDSLRRIQVDTYRRASDIEQLLIRKKTPLPRH